MDFFKIANHPLMWIAAGASVVAAIFQSIIFLKKSITTGRKLGVTNMQIKDVIQSTTVISLGLYLSTAVGLVSLVAAVGAPLGWSRLSLVGALSHELMGVNFAAKAMDTQIGDPGFDKTVFAVAVWVLVLGSIGWPLLTGLFTDKIEKLRNMLAKKDQKGFEVMSTAAAAGAFAFIVGDFLVGNNLEIVTGKVKQIDPSSVAVLTGALSMFLIRAFNEERNIKWLNQWSMVISMFTSLIITTVFFS